MGNFNRGGGGGFGGNRSNFGGNRGGGRPDFRRDGRNQVTMTKVTCDACHKPCEVPFIPTAGKPVYCNDCFRKQNAGGDRAPRRDFNDRPQAPRPSFTVGSEAEVDSTKKQLELLNSKIDKLISSIEVLTLAKSKPKTEVIKTMTVSLPKKGVKKETKKKSSKK